MSLYVMILCKVLTYTCSSYRSFSVMWSFFALKLPHLCEWNWHRCLGFSSLYCCFSCYLSSFSYSPFLLIYDPCLHDVIFFLLILLLHSPVSTSFFSFSHCWSFLPWDSKEGVEVYSALQTGHDLQFRGAETRLDPSWTSLEHLIGMFDELNDDFGQSEEGSVFQEIDQFQWLNLTVLIQWFRP